MFNMGNLQALHYINLVQLLYSQQGMLIFGKQ
jgi:hypothetical protein